MCTDGEWEQCIIDDKLYLISPDFNESLVSRFTQEEWQKNYQTGSRALYFASCSDENETWLPLLEKAYAKAHGDYLSIRGGWTGYHRPFSSELLPLSPFANDVLLVKQSKTLPAVLPRRFLLMTSSTVTVSGIMSF